MIQTAPELQRFTENRYVSTAQVSHALGVSVTTVKRWVDDGILPAHRTAGGHRKLLLVDVLRLVRDGNLPQADLSRLMPKSASSHSTNPNELLEEFVSACDQNHANRIQSLLVGANRAGISMDLLADRVVGPAMHRIGHRWESGEISVMHEHRITQVVVSAMYKLTAQLQANADPDRPIAIGGPERDHYLLPTLMAKLTLLDCGWEAVNLGPHTPFGAFESAIDEFHPQLIWLSMTHLEEPERFVEEYSRFYRLAEDRGIAVAIGGQALTEQLRTRIPYTTFGDGMMQLASFARTLFRRPGRPKRGRPAGRATEPTERNNSQQDTSNVNA